MISNSSQYYDSIAHSFQKVERQRAKYNKAVDNRVVALLNQHGPGFLLDVGCGDGRRSLEIAHRTGWRCMGLDTSENMVLRARSIGLDVRHADMSEDCIADEIEHADAVTLLWNVLGHVSSSRRRHLLANCWRILSSDGMLIFDVNNVLNASEYGWKSALHNLLCSVVAPSHFLGDYVIHASYGVKASTISHLFYPKEITKMLTDISASGRIEYLEYDTGNSANLFTGQMLVIAQK